MLVPTRVEQEQRLERLVKMFENRNKNKSLDFTKLKWSVFDELFYSYLDLKEYQITFEPCKSGFDVGIYKKNGESTAIVLEKLCTNCTEKSMTLDNVIDRAIETAEYLNNKYIKNF